MRENISKELNQVMIDLGIEKRTENQKKKEIENDIKYYEDMLLKKIIVEESRREIEFEIKKLKIELKQMK